MRLLVSSVGVIAITSLGACSAYAGLCYWWMWFMALCSCISHTASFHNRYHCHFWTVIPTLINLDSVDDMVHVAFGCAVSALSLSDSRSELWWYLVLNLGHLVGGAIQPVDHVSAYPYGKHIWNSMANLSVETYGCQCRCQYWRLVWKYEIIYHNPIPVWEALMGIWQHLGGMNCPTYV